MKIVEMCFYKITVRNHLINVVVKVTHQMQEVADRIVPFNTSRGLCN